VHPETSISKQQTHQSGEPDGGDLHANWWFFHWSQPTVKYRASSSVATSWLLKS